MKPKFLNELEMALVKERVLLCGGNANLVDDLLKPPPLTFLPDTCIADTNR